MNLFRKIEGFFRKHWRRKGFLDKKFPSSVQPVEIAKKMARTMEDERRVGASYVYVPNWYAVFLSKADMDRLVHHKIAFISELRKYLTRKAGEKGYKIIGRIALHLEVNQNLRAGQYTIEWKYTKPSLKEEPGTHGEVTADTQIFTKVSVLPCERDSVSAKLTVIKGLGTGNCVHFEANRVNMGRRESNEMPLADINTSRLHAYIVFAKGGHVLYDAKSLNGTYVNNQRITCKRLQGGDQIRLGNTVILYEAESFPSEIRQ